RRRHLQRQVAIAKEAVRFGQMEIRKTKESHCTPQTTLDQKSSPSRIEKRHREGLLLDLFSTVSSQSSRRRHPQRQDEIAKEAARFGQRRKSRTVLYSTLYKCSSSAR
uniref:HTH_Tnp_Tc3_1 domain-containing protein n=1 Tax=Steinernema glaseri TaxID=37863 RepID=A0A1I7XWR7_9BILA